MSINLIVVLTFLLVLVVLFWIMSDQSASRVTNSLKSLLQVLPVSQIIKSIQNKEGLEDNKAKIDVEDDS